MEEPAAGNGQPTRYNAARNPNEEAAKLMSKKIPLGLIGVQKWGKTVGKAMVESDVVDLAWVFDINADAAAEAGFEWDARVASSLKQLLKSEVAGVVIVTPNHTHAELGIAAARAGKHPMIIKPITNTMAEGRELLAACEQAGVFCATNHPHRKSAMAARIKQMVEADEFGQLILAVNATGHGGGMNKTADDWRAQRSKAPGGPLMQLTVHTFDTWQYWFGPIAEIQAIGGHVATPGDNDDYFAGQARFASGLVGNFSTQYASPGAGFNAIYGTLRTVSGEHGDLVDHRLLTDLDPKAWPRTKREVIELDDFNSITADVDDFARDITAGRQPHASGEDGLRAVACVHAAIQSSDRNGAWVNVDEVMAG